MGCSLLPPRLLAPFCPSGALQVLHAPMRSPAPLGLLLCSGPLGCISSLPHAGVFGACSEEGTGVLPLSRGTPWEALGPWGPPHQNCLFPQISPSSSEGEGDTLHPVQVCLEVGGEEPPPQLCTPSPPVPL